MNAASWALGPAREDQVTEIFRASVNWVTSDAGVLAPVVVIALMHIVRGRGVVLAHVGGIIGILGSAGGAMIGLHSLFIVALADNGGGAGNAVLTGALPSARPATAPTAA